jgi:hypothetical protein
MRADQARVNELALTVSSVNAPQARLRWVGTEYIVGIISLRPVLKRGIHSSQKVLVCQLYKVFRVMATISA